LASLELSSFSLWPRVMGDRTESAGGHMVTTSTAADQNPSAPPSNFTASRLPRRKDCSSEPPQDKPEGSGVTRYEPDTPRRERAAKGTCVSHARGGVAPRRELASDTAR